MVSPRLKIRATASLLRPFNLLLIVVIQLVVHQEVIAARGLGSLLTTRELVLVILMTVTIAAAGYVINDIHDVQTDKINKPGRNFVGTILPVAQAWVIYWILTLTGAAACLLLIPAYSFVAPLIFSLTTAGLWLYSALFKKQPLIGNLMVSVFCALVVFILWIPQVAADRPEEHLSAGSLIWAYVLFSFLITMIRELIKDIEDVEGDRASGARTAPVVWGIESTSRFAQGLIGLLLFCIIIWHGWNLGAFLWWHLAYIALTVLVPLMVIARRLRSPDQSEMRAYSTIVKVIVVFGTFYLMIL